MGNKLLVFLTVLVSIFIGLCVAIIVMVQNPDLNKNLSNFFNKETKQETTIETTKKKTSTPSIIIVEEPKLNTEIKTYTSHKGKVSIEYPMISGLDDTNLEQTINNKIYNNAISIVPLYPISTSMQTLTIKAKVDFLDENKINIIYTGAVVGKTVVSDNYTYTYGSGSSSSTNNNYSKGASDNPSNNYQTGGNTNYQVPSTLPNNQVTMPSQNVPRGNVINGSQAPGTNTSNSAPISGQSRTIDLNQKIFYTNCIDLKTGKDLKISDFVKDIESLAKYARSSKAEYVNVDSENISKVRKYVQLSTATALTEVFTKADFKNTTLTAWPKSFSYVKDNYLYFTVRLNTVLGNYVIIKYKLN